MLIFLFVLVPCCICFVLFLHAQLKAGDVYQKKKDTLEYDEKLRGIVLTYNIKELSAYLDSLILLI